MNPAGDTKKEAQRLASIGSLFTRKLGAVAHFADIISETSDVNGDTKANAQKPRGCIGSLLSCKPETVAHFADTISETSDVNVTGPHSNTASKPETPNAKTGPKQLTTEVETIQIDMDIDLEMQVSDNNMNASDKILDSCKIATMMKKSVAMSVTNRSRLRNSHEKAQVKVSEKINQLDKNTKAFSLKNDDAKASNQAQSPGSATNSDDAPSNPEQEIGVNTLPKASDQQPILRKETNVLEKPDPEANAQPKTNVQRENLSKYELKEDNNENENEEPVSNNQSSTENENLREKVQKLEETLAQFQEQMKQLQFEICNKMTSQNIVLESARPELQQNHKAPAIAKTSSETMPDPSNHHALTDCQPTLMPVIDKQSAISEEYINLYPSAVLSATKDNGCKLNTTEHFHGDSEEAQVFAVARSIMTTDQACDNGNNQLSQQNEVHTPVVPNASINITATFTSVSIHTETPPFKRAHVSNRQIGSRASELPIVPQEPLLDDEMPLRLRLRSREQKHDLPVEIKRTCFSRTEQMLPHIGETLTSNSRAHNSRKENHRESNESKIQSNSKPKVRLQLKKKSQISQLYVSPIRAVNVEKHVPKAKAGQKRPFDGEKRHKCKLCQYATNKTSHLTRHMRTHTGEKPYKCRFCKFAAAESSDLIWHMRTQRHKNALKLHTSKSTKNAK